MTGGTAGEDIVFVLDKTSLDALYFAPVPLFITQDDGRVLFINHIVEKTIDLRNGDEKTLDDIFAHFHPYTATGDPIDLQIFFKSSESQKIVEVEVETADNKKLVWRIFTATFGQNTSGKRIFLSLARESCENLTLNKQIAEIMDRVGPHVSFKKKEIDTVITALENELIEKNRIRDALTLSRERLKRISRHTLDILEADRQNISKELHDSIGASLAAIKFSLEEKELQRKESGNRLDQSLNQEVDYLVATIKETKRISANLRPSTLDELGLSATISWYLRQFQRLYGDIHIVYSSEIIEEDVPEPMKINIYRIIQEGLTNAERHSGASEIQLRMSYCDGGRSLSLSIEDDGCGFSVREKLSNRDPLSGYGLVAMRERCEIVGGLFQLDSGIGKGTRLRAILPIS